MIQIKRYALVCAAAVFSLLPISVQAVDWNPLPDSGQTTCYDTAGNILEPCPEIGQPLYGQDGQYSGLAMFFTDNGNGTVTDSNTGLVWQQNTADTDYNGSVNSSDQLPWQDALDYCANLFFAGHNNWHLPEIFELRSLVESDRYNPAIDRVFSCNSSIYWSATSLAAANTANAWGQDFDTGRSVAALKSDSLYVRCIRTGL